jgi:hypothetical protein
VTLPTVAAEALVEHLGVSAEAGPDGLVFPAELARFAAATSSGASGSRPPEPPGSRACGSTTYATPPRPWRSWPVPAPGSRWCGWGTPSAAALRYQHVMAGRDAAIAAALDELVQAASTRRSARL